MIKSIDKNGWYYDLATVEGDQKAWLCLQLKKYREKHKLTQKQLAAKIGRSQSYVHNIENGKRELTVPEFVEYALHIGFNAPAAMVFMTGPLLDEGSYPELP